MIQSIGDKILCQFNTKQIESSLIIPEHVQSVLDKESDCVVVSVGTDPTITIKVGDIVIFNPAAAMMVKILDKEYVLLTEKAIVCVTNFDREGR